MKLRTAFFLIIAALAALPLAHADTGQVQATARLAAVQAQAARIYAIAADIEQANTKNRQAIVTDLPARLDRTRDAINRLSRALGSDAIATRKLQQLTPLMHALDRAAHAASADMIPTPLIPAHLASGQRARFDLIGARSGATCAGALGLGPDRERDGWIPAQGEVWFRFDAVGPALYRVHTAATPLDTEIAVFSECPASKHATPLVLNDDTFGLAAAAPVDLRAAPGPRWIRVRNLGAAGNAAVIADAASSVSGRVTDIHGGAAIANAQVQLYAPFSGYAGSANTDSSGNYTIAVAPGSYYVGVSASGYLSLLWPNFPCQFSYYGLANCDLTQATEVVVLANTSTSGIDFALDTGAQISGRARDAVSGAVTADANVTLFDQTGNVVMNSGVDAAGRYVFNALPAGTYYAQATSNTHVAQLYQHVDCASSCNPTSGSPITLGNDAQRQNIDFDLTPLLYVNVTVSAPGANDFIFGTMSIYDASGAFVSSQSLYGNQVNTVGPLAAGGYYFAANFGGYFNQLYNHVDCPLDCANNFAQATLVTVADNLSTPALTFSLTPTPSVSGRVTDLESGLGLANATIELVPVSNNGYSSPVAVAADGTYSISQLAPGNYYVVARSPDHRDTVYPNGPCSEQGYGVSGCALALAQTVTVAYGASNVTHIDMALPANASIAGAVIYRTPGTSSFPIANAGVQLVDAQGYAVATTNAGADGTYQFIDLDPGTYYAEAIDSRYFSQIYAGVDCPLVDQSCNPVTGTPITLSQGQKVAAINFNPVANAMIVGRVTDSASDAGVSGTALDLWNGSDNTHCGITVTDANGYYVLGDNAYCLGPSRKITTDAGSAFIDQVYDGIACPLGPAYLGLCPLDGATLIAIPATQPQPIVANFLLNIIDPIFANGFD